jgi:hypothetical protein
MKRLALALGLLVLGSLIPGCPIYTNDDGCVVDAECDIGYVCDGAVGLCRTRYDGACRSPSECGANETCSRQGSCVVGDCSWPQTGCVTGYVCSKQSGAFSCVAGTSGGASGSGGTGGGAGEGAGGMLDDSGGVPGLGAGGV